jgi:hypothetical protein
MICVRLSLRGAAHVAVASSAKQVIRERFGRDAKGEGRSRLWVNQNDSCFLAHSSILDDRLGECARCY